MYVYLCIYTYTYIYISFKVVFKYSENFPRVFFLASQTLLLFKHTFESIVDFKIFKPIPRVCYTRRHGRSVTPESSERTLHLRRSRPKI